MPGHARYRAPSESGQKLVVPPWQELDGLIAANRAWRTENDFDLLGRPLSELAVEARRELLELRGPADQLAAAAPFIVTGHQPGLVHPGVWVKNFAAAKLAAQHGGIGWHIVIDADVCRTPAIFVPAGSVEAPHLAAVDFDQPAPPLPWEERRILDFELWRTFPQRVAKAGGVLVEGAFLHEWWPIAIERAAATGLVGAALAQARHRAETDWHTHNLELPQSQLCQTNAFRRFACTLLAELPQFVEAYNGVLGEYRRAHGLRNHAQPVPNLAADGPWLEAPLWIWTAADPRRRAVYVRRTDRGLLVSDRKAIERLLPLTGTGDAAAAVATLGEWEAAGVKIRSRALVTTLFTRLMVADLFIHGIGGAKYDEATDAISERFFSVAPPKFAALSGTLRLPIPHPPGDGADARRLRTELRELEFHPERRLSASPAANGKQKTAAALIAEKTRWIQSPKLPATAAERHRGIAAANGALQTLVTNDRAALERELSVVLARARANRVLESREFAFCLFPRKLLDQFLLDFTSAAL